MIDNVVNNENDIIELFVSKSKKNVLSKDEKKAQRQRHFDNAYNSVDNKVLKKIQEVYNDDFLLFGYDRAFPL